MVGVEPVGHQRPGGAASPRDLGVTSIALYLPQFHPVAENDEWWGPGFSEWTNVARARPLFPGHYQPHLPGELGFYDLRAGETRAAQAALARQHGITAFCFWHYWFAGRRMLERPVDEWVACGEPDFPFCLGWANETWGGRWVGATRDVLIEQTYPGDDDHRRHFDALLEAFHDPRYLRVDGRPFFLLYRPTQLPDLDRFVDLWRTLAADAGLPGLFLVGQAGPSEAAAPLASLDAIHRWRILPLTTYRASVSHARYRPYLRYLSSASGRTHLRVVRYGRWAPFCVATDPDDRLSIPAVVPGWDNTPRTRWRGIVYHDADPAAFGCQVTQALRALDGRPREDRILLVRSWNEWAEGNHLEPDRRYGRGHLEAFRDAVEGFAWTEPPRVG
jgi:lipopolysaccharide biosynthesis protein